MYTLIFFRRLLCHETSADYRFVEQRTSCGAATDLITPRKILGIISADLTEHFVETLTPIATKTDLYRQSIARKVGSLVYHIA